MLGKNLVSSVLTQVPLFVLGIVSGIFSTRILGDESKGVFALFQANTQLFVLIFSLGIQTGIVYFISSSKIKKELVAGMSITIFAISSLILLVLLICSQLFGFSHWFLPSDFTSNIYLTSLFVLFSLTFVNSILSGFYQAHSKFVLLNWISVTNSIINTVLFAGLFLYLSTKTIDDTTKLNYVLGITIFALILNTSILLYFQFKRIHIRFDFHFTLKKHITPFVIYNTSIYIGVFVNFFNYRLDLWLINIYLDDKDLSYYSLAANIVQIILYIATAIAGVMLPNLSSRTGNDRILTFLKITRISFVLFVGIVISAVLLSSFVIPFLYGADFTASVFPFQLLLIGILFSCCTQLFAQLLLVENQNKLNILACTVGLGITIVAGITLIPIYGIAGASIATTLTYLVIFTITYIFVIRYTKTISLNLFIPNKNDIAIIRNLINKKR